MKIYYCLKKIVSYKKGVELNESNLYASCRKRL